MTAVAWWMAQMLARGLEPVEREAALGDLWESGDSGAKAVLAIAGLLARRQGEAWKDWRPWLALFGLAGPVGLLLFDFSRSLASTFQLYAWIVENYGVIELQLLEETGLTLRHGSVVFVSFLLLLLVWSWTGGFALAALSGRAMWINAPLLGLVWCAYAVANPDLPPWPASSLVWLSFVWGAREGLRRRSLTRRRAAALFLATVLLTATAIVTAGWWRAGNGPSRQVAVALILSWPVCYLMAAAYWRLARPSVLKTLSILVLCLCALPLAAEVQLREQRKPAPSFSLRDAKGKEVRLAQYRGKVLLLNFWATWCGGCKQEMPYFDQIQRTLGRKKFAALGVSVDEKGWSVVNPFVKSTKVKYRMALATAETTSQFDVKSLPATFVIDKDGNVAATYRGLIQRKDLEADLRTLLAAE